ncbi:MAG: transposase, partial [Clostridia bacterium]|nr:transposase [Clostridia bacterium]
IKLIKDYKYKNKETGLVVLWVKLRGAGYTRTITSLYRVMQRIGIYNKAPSKKKEYEPKPYQQMTYPGERVQIDVKYVPKKSLTKEVIEQDGRYYQYTAIDEYTRKRVLWASKEQSTSASTEFLGIIIKKFPFKIECIQTDNGFEFTNRLNWQGTKKKTMFEKKLEELGIEHKLIKPKTPRHNGKVERSHRKDQERFYYNKVFCSFEDFKNRLKYWEKVYNDFPMKPLKWLSPNEKYLEYIKG